jgi:hypothetical protein
MFIISVRSVALRLVFFSSQNNFKGNAKSHRSWDSIVVVIRLRAGWSRVLILTGARDFSFPQMSIPCVVKQSSRVDAVR